MHWEHREHTGYIHTGNVHNEQWGSERGHTRNILRTIEFGNRVNIREHTGNTLRKQGKWNPEGTQDTIGNTLGTGNRVSNTDCFCVDSVGPAAGGLPQVTHSEHQEQSGHRGGKIGKTGNKREHISNTGFNREHWEQWRPHREHRTQSGTHSTHICWGNNGKCTGNLGNVGYTGNKEEQEGTHQQHWDQ